jgi:hypothetical protein
MILLPQLLDCWNYRHDHHIQPDLCFKKRSDANQIIIWDVMQDSGVYLASHIK